MCIRNKSQCTKIAIKWERLHSLGKISFLYYSSCGEQCCIQPFTWLLLSNTQFISISLFSQMQTPGVDPSFSSLFPTLGFGGFDVDLVSWHFRECYLDLFFSFGLQFLFQTSCLPSELLSNGSGQATAPTLMSLVVISHLDFPPLLQPPHTSSASVFVSSCPNIYIYDNMSEVCTFFSLPRQLLTWL